jgi:hypothetical protein
MNRLIFHRDDVESILRGAVEAGRTLVSEQESPEFVRGYAAALKLILVSFGFTASSDEQHDSRSVSGQSITFPAGRRRPQP